MPPLVSVVIPCLNGQPFLPQAFAGIERQGIDDIEIILVDDGSSDGSADWAAAQPKTQVIRGPGQGPSAARNAGLKIAHGEFIALLDADDWWPDYKLALQLHWFRLQPELQVVHGRVRWRPEPGMQRPDLLYETPDGRLPMINLGAGLWRREAFERAGTFDESLRFAEDQDWFMRCREVELPLLVLRDVTLEYRLHPSSMTAGPAPPGLGLQQALLRSLQRRRKSGKTAPLPPWTDFDEFARPSISVIIPVWNGEAFLAEAIESALNQTLVPDEIIVVDDGSTDRSAAIAQSFGARVRLISGPHEGPSAARNRGVEVSRGSLIAFLDADDLWLPAKLEKQLARFRQDLAADIVFTHLEQFDQATGAARPPEPGFLPSSVLMRRGAWLRTGPLDTRLRAGEFIHWLAQARAAGLAESMVEEPLTRRRVHTNNYTRVHRENLSDFARLAKAALDRRRQARES